MLASFHRSGGLATANRAIRRRSGDTERITRLYSKFDALFRRARLCARAVANLIATRNHTVNSIQNLAGAGAAGPALACTTSRHQTPGAQ